LAALELAQALVITGHLQLVETTNEARLAVAQQAGVRRVQWSANLETRTCPLCRYLDGKVFIAASAPWNPPAHINCDCIWIAVEDDEVGDVDAIDLDDPAVQAHLQSLVDDHGHFLTNPEKYQPLRIPSAPGGRDFVVRRTKIGENVVTVLEWARPRYDIAGLAIETVQTGVAEVAAPWVPFPDTSLPPLPTSPPPPPEEII